MPIHSTPAGSEVGTVPAPSSAVRGASSKDSPEKIRKAAIDFEALLITQMLKSARESGGGMTGDSDEQDETNSTMVELGEQHLAQALSSSGGLGIANTVIAGFSKHAH
jgi:Rod binding domain-containing protein